MMQPGPIASRLEGVAGATQDIALSDPDFQFPRVLRSTLGYDRELPWGIRGTVEALYSMNQEEVFYQNINKVQTGTSAGTEAESVAQKPGGRCISCHSRIRKVELG